LGTSHAYSQNNYDIIISNGRVVDGSGNPWYEADVAINGERIVRIGDLSSDTGSQVIDANGLIVAPGFIDPHTHALRGILDVPTAESALLQGVTTLTEGNDGTSPFPVDEHYQTILDKQISPNWGIFVGHGTIRSQVIGAEDRDPTPVELEQMKDMVQQAMQHGALGLSTGLFYVPGSFASTEEVIELSKVAAKHGGIYISHMREEAAQLIDSVNETIRIGEESGIPVQMTHHKVIGKPMWGKSAQTLSLVDSARTIGLKISLDQYPYDASYTGISVLIPSWARAGGQKEFIKRTKDASLRDSIKRGIEFNILNDRGGNDLDRVQFAKVSWNKSLEGKTLKYWANSLGLEPSVENGAELVIKAQLNGGASAIFHAMDEKDVENIMKHPLTMIASDGRLVVPGDGHPHPRWYGTFPRVLGHFVREKKTLSLEEAIYKMSLLPAQTIGIKNRGLIKKGMYADITIFDKNTIIDKATFESPHQYSEGIYYVLVNGEIAIDNGEFKNIKAGVVLKKNAP
jgi:dihydroorotase/N-acyl-D-amino-acid deacylase